MDEQAHELMRQMQDEEMRQHEEDKVNAFPLKYVSQGMELRDYFAARAMQSMIITDHCHVMQVAISAYEMADRMMEERDAHQDGTR
jgi:regulator of extracellular matrix RemA (YlzA/DUF370 family)